VQDILLITESGKVQSKFKSVH